MAKKVRQTALLKSYARTWGEWKEVEITDEMRGDHPHLKHCKNIWTNNRYEVQAFAVESAIGGVWQVTAIRHGDIEPISWEELQRAIHDLYGPEVTAIEIYPALVNEWRVTKHIRVVWILPTTWPLPFGLHVAGSWGVPIA